MGERLDFFYEDKIYVCTLKNEKYKKAQKKIKLFRKDRKSVV